MSERGKHKRALRRWHSACVLIDQLYGLETRAGRAQLSGTIREKIKNSKAAAAKCCGVGAMKRSAKRRMGGEE